MNDKQFYFAVSEASAYASRDAYISDIAMSSMWGDDESGEIPPERISVLGETYDACRRSVRDIVAAAGMTQRAFAERFCIPLRTVEDWCAGKRECAVYLRLMMQECLGLLRR